MMEDFMARDEKQMEDEGEAGHLPSDLQKHSAMTTRGKGEALMTTNGTCTSPSYKICNSHNIKTSWYSTSTDSCFEKKKKHHRN